MARTATQIQADIDAVRAEMASSVSEVRFSDGKGMTKRSTASAFAALSILQNELSEASAVAAGSTRPRQIRLSGSSGFGPGSGFDC